MRTKSEPDEEYYRRMQRERHIEIMEAWVRKIVSEVAQDLADGIVAQVGAIFLEAKEGAYELRLSTHNRLEVLEKALKAKRGAIPS